MDTIAGVPHFKTKRTFETTVMDTLMPTFDIDTFVKESDWLKADEGRQVLHSDFERIAVVELQVHVNVQSQVRLDRATQRLQQVLQGQHFFLNTSVPVVGTSETCLEPD